MTFRNRCIIAGANGPINLTVPVEGGRNQRTLMKDVRILNSEKWQLNHWKTICSAYKRSPWFDYFEDELAGLYRSSFEYLKDWNLACFSWACDKLSIRIAHSFTEVYRPDYGAEVTDWRNLLKPATINVLFPNAPEYTQVFMERHGFIPNLSVLDYLFCVGK